MYSSTQDSEFRDFTEVDPTGRFGRYNEILGKGSSKTVYRAFDEYEGIEVAWNQVKLNDFLQSPEDLERLYCEIHLLKTLKHKNIMNFCSSWVDVSKRKINFVTEMFTSGTLRQYRQKHRRVNIRAVKHWCRQILSALLYLHSHDPPIIHRDLKCDNVFVNGNQGEVKIGDLGLAAILRKPHADHCVGTPEFMAPEVYEEAYNELVDIYSFGMCVLEMVTFEYPYSECTHPAQIYKRVISGKKPDALYKVKDPEVRQFVDKCLATVSERLSAKELLNDPFLQITKHSSAGWEGDITTMGYTFSQPYHSPLNSDCSLTTSRLSSDDLCFDVMVDTGCDCNAEESETHRLNLFYCSGEEPSNNSGIMIEGMRRDDGSIFLRLRVCDRKGHARNIYFPFDVENDTALGVAAEMVAELNITNHDITQIAEIIDGEVSSLVPERKPCHDIASIPGNATPSLSDRCDSNVSSSFSYLNYLSANNQSCGNLSTTSCSHVNCDFHGRFEEVTYHAKELKCDEVGSPCHSSNSGVLYSNNRKEGNRSMDLTADVKNLNSQNRPPEIQQDLEAHKKESYPEKCQMVIGDGMPSCDESLCLKGSEEQNVIENASIRRTLQGSAVKPLKSFHLGTNFSYRIPPNDILSGDKVKANRRKKKSVKKGDGSRQNSPPFEAKSSNSTEGIFEKGVSIQDAITHAITSVPSHFKWMLKMG